MTSLRMLVMDRGPCSHDLDGLKVLDATWDLGIIGTSHVTDSLQRIQAIA
jgi:hypothetical protein